MENNIVGTNTAGAAGLGNSSTGIAVDSGAIQNTIAGNVVSGNLYGVAVVGTGTSGNLVEDNFIGVVVEAGVTSPLSNSYGVLLQSGRPTTQSAAARLPPPM